MITKAQAEAEAKRVIQTPGQRTWIGSSRDLRGGWAFFPEPRAIFESTNAYGIPAIIVRVEDGYVHQTNGSTFLEHELRHLGMSLGAA